MRLGQRTLLLQEAGQRFGRQSTALQSQGDTVAGKGVDESGGVAGQHHAAILRLRRAEVERRGGDGGEERLPLPAALPEFGMGGKNLFQGTRGPGLHHGGRVDRIWRHPLYAAATTREEIQIYRTRRRILSKVGLHDDPLCLGGYLMLRQVRPTS